jgi:hypothetical protein
MNKLLINQLNLSKLKIIYHNRSAFKYISVVINMTESISRSFKRYFLQNELIKSIRA